MPELSKTARASMGKVEKKVKIEESTEEAIRQIRLDRQAKLAILREDRIDRLLAAYDGLKRQLETLQGAEPGSLALEIFDEATQN